jgi:hypothetical protein
MLVNHATKGIVVCVTDPKYGENNASACQGTDAAANDAWEDNLESQLRSSPPLLPRRVRAKMSDAIMATDAIAVPVESLHRNFDGEPLL